MLMAFTKGRCVMAIQTRKYGRRRKAPKTVFERDIADCLARETALTKPEGLLPDSKHGSDVEGALPES